MNINLLYSLVTILSFIITFDVNNLQRQDYFLLDGNGTSAHLFRYNETVYLLLRSKSNYELYQGSVSDNIFEFKWDDFSINNQSMMLNNSSGGVIDTSYNTFTFLNPNFVHDNDIGKISNAEQLHQYPGNTNYSVVVFIVLGIGLLLKSDKVALKVYSSLLKNVNNEEVFDDTESAYVEMESL